MESKKEKYMLKTPLIESLSDISRKYPREEKILIAPDYGIARQVLQALVKSGTPWMNFHLSAASALAQDVAEESLISGNFKRLTGPGILAIIDDIFNRLYEAGELRYFERHQTNTGLNHALTSVIMELRTKGISPSGINQKYLTTPEKGHDIKLILSGYEDFLKENVLIDKPGLTMLALRSLEKRSPATDSKYIIFSRYYMSGLEREFMEKFAGDSLVVIEDGRVFGLRPPRGTWIRTPDREKVSCLTDIERLSWLYAPKEAPAPLNDGSIEMFSAIGFRNEIKEIMRRVVKDSIPADQVEIVYTDPAVYGREIFYICEKLNIPVTFSEGIPVYTRRPFRAIIGFLEWIKHDLMEIYLRRMLEGEDIRLDPECGMNIDGPTLANFLRASGVGWGRERYSRVLGKKVEESLKKIEKPVNDEESDMKERYMSDADNARTLNLLCERLLAFVPCTDEDGKIEVTELCEGCINFLDEYAVVSGDEDISFVADAKGRLSMIGQFGSGKVDMTEAVEKLIGTISAIKVGTSEPVPGHIHVSYYKHGGRTGRPNTFIVGLDESRFPGRGLQDPILLDIERKAIGRDMELSTDKTKKNIYDMASMLAGLRGKVTASFSSFNVKEEKKVFPSSVLLQIYRLIKGDPESDYDEMLRYMAGPVSTTSKESRDLPLDISEWWISNLAEDEIIKDGMGAVVRIYPGIEAGLEAEDARNSSEFTRYDGKIYSLAGELDPRENKKMVLSCSKLETAAGCPYKYFVSTVLGIQKPEETIKDPAAWLNPMQKGSLLHEVFEKFTGELRKKEKTLSREQQKESIMEILCRTAEKYKENIPPPNDIVYEGEYLQMVRDTEIFLSINESLKTSAVYEELAFGTGGEPPVSIPLPNERSIFLRGIVDRIDKAGENEYHVWDYKTGSAYKYENRQYIKGGEMLQHALYAQAVEIILKEKEDAGDPVVTLSGYLLPSEKGCGDGKGSIFARDPSKKEIWQKGLDLLLDLISSGSFFISDEAQCSFCDYSHICGDKTTKERSKLKRSSGDEHLNIWGELKSYE